MSNREKLLAAAVGTLLSLFAVYGVYRSVKGGIDMRATRITALDRQISEEEQQKTQSLRDANLVQEYKLRSLDANLAKANLEFDQWLKGQVEEVGLADSGTVTYKDIRQKTDDYRELTYTINCQGNVKQITDLLYRIQSADTLHRVETIMLRQAPNDDDLRLDMNVAALSMGDAGKPKVKVGQPGDGKLAKSLDEYHDVISVRNMFAPANNPPKFASPSRETVELGSDLVVRLSASDPDDHELSYKLIDSPDDTAELDGRRLRWTPKELGDYEFEIEVEDDGVPSKKAVAKLRVEVVPEQKEEEPVREEFDEATLAYLTGFVKGPKDPEPAIWIDLRSKGESMTLVAGDKIDIGTWKGVVKELRPFENMILLESEEGDAYEMKIGQKLSDAKPIEL